MMLSNIEKNIVKASLGNDLLSISDHNKHTFVKINASALVKAITLLYANDDLLFNVLIDSFAVDLTDAEYDSEKFELYYQLYSKKLNKKLFITTEIEGEEVYSLTVVFENIDWYEREMFDMFGIKFARHQDLRRILTAENSPKYPLRKQV